MKIQTTSTTATISAGIVRDLLPDDHPMTSAEVGEKVPNT
jgi:hypothetical protein